MTKDMYGINNKSNGVVRTYVTTSVTHKPEVRIDLLTFTHIVNNFAVVMLVHNLFVNYYSCLPNFHAFRRGQLCLE